MGRKKKVKKPPKKTVDTIDLSAHLWKSVNIMRGPMDQANFTSYIFLLWGSNGWDPALRALEPKGSSASFLKAAPAWAD